MMYRKPSIKTLLGITRAKRRIKKALGIYIFTRYWNIVKNTKVRIKRKSGYYSEPMKVFRFLSRIFK